MEPKLPDQEPKDDKNANGSLKDKFKESFDNFKRNEKFEDFRNYAKTNPRDNDCLHSSDHRHFTFIFRTLVWGDFGWSHLWPVFFQRGH